MKKGSFRRFGDAEDRMISAVDESINPGRRSHVEEAKAHAIRMRAAARARGYTCIWLTTLDGRGYRIQVPVRYNDND